MFWIIALVGLYASVVCIWGFFVKMGLFTQLSSSRTNGLMYPVKFLSVYLLLSLRKLWNFIKFEDAENPNAITQLLAEASEKYEGKSAGYGSKSRAHPVLMDEPQPLSPHEMAIDAVYFNGFSQDGWNFIVGTARRPKGVFNGFLFVKIPGVGLLSSPRIPDTTMYQTFPSQEFAVEGIKLTPVVPMAAWRVEYEGILRVESACDGSSLKEKSMVKVNFKGLWTSVLPYFDFDVDMSPYAVASAMAMQPWHREYFNLLKRNHQTHYEQFGELTGTVSVNDQTYEFNLCTMRDHSYGYKRDWRDFHRYALHFFTAKNGLKFHVGVICMPSMFSRIVIGYVYTPEGSVHAVDSTTFNLHEHGEAGKPPTDYGFSFTAGGKTYDVNIEVDSSIDLYMTETWDARIVESFAKAKVNGYPAWGAVEFNYRHTAGKPAAMM